MSDNESTLLKLRENEMTDKQWALVKIENTLRLVNELRESLENDGAELEIVVQSEGTFLFILKEKDRRMGTYLATGSIDKVVSELGAMLEIK